MQLTVALRDSASPNALFTWARGQGLSVRWRAGDDWAFVTGTAPKVANAFGVAVHNFRSRGGRVFYASRQQAAVPAPVAAQVTGLGRILSYHSVRVATPPARPRDVPPRGLTPTQLLTTYNAGPLATTGKDQTIVFFELDGYDQFDLDSYAKTFGLSTFTPTPVGGRLESGVETEMDLEVAHALAPDARLVVANAFAGFGLDKVKGDVNKYLASAEFHQNVANMFESVDRQFPGAIWSFSLGFDCDKMTNPHDVRPVRAALQKAEEHGTSAFTSSGDTGGLECKNSDDFSTPPTPDDVGVNTLAALPEMTDVGGTSLSTDEHGVRLAEAAWVNSPMSQGTGGGVAQLFALPLYQIGTASSPKDFIHRLTPDVAADADPFTGVYVLTPPSQWNQGGGTSQSAPIWAALTALMNQYLIEHGGKALGEMNPMLYGVARRVAAGTAPARPAFFDVTLGGNAVDSAGPGYDLVTGLGTPNTDNLVQDLLDIQRGQG